MRSVKKRDWSRQLGAIGVLFRLLWERTPISGMALAFSSMPHARGALDSGGASGDQLYS